MKSKYNILFSNTDNYKIIKFENNIYNLKETNANIDNKSSYTKLLSLLLLIIIFKIQIFKIDKKGLHLIDSKKEEIITKEKWHKEFWNTTFLKNEMHSYSLYDEFKFPFISLIIMKNEGQEQNLIEIINQIKNISYNNNFTNFEIILDLKKGNRKEKKLIEKELKQFKKDIILNIYNEKTNKDNYYSSSLINSIRGLFTIFVKHYNLFLNK